MGKICVFLAEGFEEIEGLMVVDLLRRAELTTVMVSISDNLYVKGGHDIEVKSDVLFEQVDYSDVDILVLPGGLIGTNNLSTHDGLIELLKKFTKENKKIAAICAAPSILGTNGLLKGRKATSYPDFWDKLDGAKVCDEKVVVDGNIITSKGLGTSLDFALELINICKSREVADRIKSSVQY